MQLPGLVGCYRVKSDPSEGCVAVLLVWISLPVMACAVVTGLCALDVLTNRSVWDQRAGGNDLQLGDCLKFTLPLCASGVALQSQERFKGEEEMEVKGSSTSSRRK